MHFLHVRSGSVRTATAVHLICLGHQNLLHVHIPPVLGQQLHLQRKMEIFAGAVGVSKLAVAVEGGHD